MSKEQWGHGYMKGRADAKSEEPITHKFICTYSKDGYLNQAYYIWKDYGEGRYTIESISLFEIEACLAFGTPNLIPAEMTLSRVEEINLKKLSNYKLFYDQFAVLSEAQKLLNKLYSEGTGNIR